MTKNESIQSRDEQAALSQAARQAQERRRVQNEAQGGKEAQKGRGKEGAEARAKSKPKEVPKPQNLPKEIPFKDAAVAAKVVAEIQSAEGRQVTVEAEEFAALKEVLAKAGYTFKQVQKMSEAQIIVEAQKVFVNKETVIEEPKVEELTASDKLEQDLSRKRVEAV